MKIPLFSISTFVVVTHGLAADLDTVKSFLSREPCYALIEFDVINNAESTLEHQYQARVCGQDYVLHDAIFGGDFTIPVSESHENPAPLLVGRSSSERWQISGYQVTRSLEPNLSSPDATSSFVDSSYLFICELLTFGAQSIRPGTFTWDGDQFTAQPNSAGQQFMRSWSDTEMADGMFSGTLTQIDERTFQISSPVHGQTIIRYSPANSLPHGWPDEIRRACKSADDCRRTLKITNAVEDMSNVDRPFAFSSYIDPQVAMTKVLSHGEVKVSPKMTAKHVALIRRDLGQHPEQSRAKRVTFISLLVAVVAALFLFGLLKRRKA